MTQWVESYARVVLNSGPVQGVWLPGKCIGKSRKKRNLSYKILSDNEFRNSPGPCNSPACPSPAIYWNPQVVHSRTGRQIPLSEPFNPQVKAPLPHQCMKKHRPGVYINKYESEEEENWNYNKLSGYHGPVPPPGVHLGTTHLWYEGQFRTLYKCPLCNFQNIHKDVINHHIFYSDDKRHNQSGVRI